MLKKINLSNFTILTILLFFAFINHSTCNDSFISFPSGGEIFQTNDSIDISISELINSDDYFSISVWNQYNQMWFTINDSIKISSSRIKVKLPSFQGGFARFRILNLDGNYSLLSNYFSLKSNLVKQVFVNKNFNPEIKELLVYPNPALTNIYLSTKEEVLNLKVYDLEGNFYFENFKSKSIQISSLKSGFYILYVRTNKSSYFKKFLKL